jgi:hypothetical protein
MIRSDGYGRTRRYYRSSREPVGNRHRVLRRANHLHFDRRPGASRMDPWKRMPMHFGHLHRDSHRFRALFVDTVYRPPVAEERFGWDSS